MDDYIKRSDAQDMVHLYAISVDKTDTLSSVLRNIIRDIPPADVRPVVCCKDCIHRPYETVPGVRYGMTVESPDRECKCPCICDDGWYSYIPDDDFFCGNGERCDGGTP